MVGRIFETAVEKVDCELERKVYVEVNKEVKLEKNGNLKATRR